MRTPTATSQPDHSPCSIRTPSMISSCPICGTPLTGQQTVCSAKCRIVRSWQKREGKQMERDAKVRLLIREALRLLDEQGDDR
jgi:predicted nucleic acid-binding Zn ribbon protein